jgi:aryl-alcohol dehydrogenase-like predicted oxidoreductase
MAEAGGSPSRPAADALSRAIGLPDPGVSAAPFLDYRSLGRTGMKVSPVCVGCFNFSNPTPENEAKRVVQTAIAGGINFFDTSGNYHQGESERVLGRAIAACVPRHDVIVATKAHFPIGPGPNDCGNSRLHLLRACEESLKRLGTDYIDLFQIHRASFDIPVDETLGALTDLVRQGKIRYAGSSTHPAWKLMEALAVSEAKGLARYVSEQPPYNLLDRRIENELVPLCQAHGVGLIPFGPVAQGVLAGRYADASRFPADSRAAKLQSVFAGRVNQPGIEVGRKLGVLARAHGLTPAQLAVLWVIAQPGITATIFGPRTAAQLEEILPVMTMRLSDELRGECDRLVPPGSAVTDFHNASFWMKQVLRP